ncbi:hypothetical protein KXQ82_10315 [Mucilaginibacter sp. HMF5004]|uniref:hypothetical protein n=1 Tax=Mucilaginibacter rivuli TaxID=2857527 RepID=UPI001C5F1FB7|nr:hypothetical protein [Mucilaginibacter rivuli]MBW4890113.1 hypothetical protein [Mucilaginibacter rivuli]
MKKYFLVTALLMLCVFFKTNAQVTHDDYYSNHTGAPYASWGNAYLGGTTYELFIGFEDNAPYPVFQEIDLNGLARAGSGASDFSYQSNIVNFGPFGAYCYLDYDFDLNDLTNYESIGYIYWVSFSDGSVEYYSHTVSDH